MWEYKIINSTLGYNIYRKRQLEGKMFNMEWLGANLKWIKDKEFAKIFYHRDDAVSALVVIRKKGGELTEGETEEKQKVEKQSWSEC